MNSDLFEDYLQAQEAQYFNWQCVVCNVIAKSPLHLEGQHMVYEHSVYTDYDKSKWVKCDECMSPFHLHCATSEPEHIVASKRFICTFFGCKK